MAKKKHRRLGVGVTKPKNSAYRNGGRDMKRMRRGLAVFRHGKPNGGKNYWR